MKDKITPILRDSDIENIEHVAKFGLDSHHRTPFAHPADTLKLVQEIKRLKSGNLCPKELDNLCHNLPEECKPEDFFLGCLNYQVKLFGKEKVVELLSQVVAHCLLGHSVPKQDCDMHYHKSIYKYANRYLEEILK